MVYIGTLATENDIKYKAGANVNPTAVTEAYLNSFVKQAEGFICSATRFNWVDVYTILNDDVKEILKDVVSNLAAIYAISFDMSGYTTRGEAEGMVTILRDAALRGISILRDKKVEDFLNGA